MNVSITCFLYVYECIYVCTNLMAKVTGKPPSNMSFMNGIFTIVFRLFASLLLYL